MNSADETIAGLERQVDLKRQALAASIDELRLRLQPAQLADEATASLRRAAVETMQQTADKVPRRISLAAGGVAVTTLALAWGLHLRNNGKNGRKSSTSLLQHDPSDDETVSAAPGEGVTDAASAEKFQDSPAMQATASWIGPSAALVSALAIGVIGAKALPPTSREAELMKEIGTDLRGILEQWVKRQVTDLVKPPPGAPMKPANMVALGLGLLLASGKTR